MTGTKKPGGPLETTRLQPPSAKGRAKRSPRRDMVSKAMRDTNRLERPDVISPRLWHGVKDVLLELCKHLPDPFPTETRLADRTGYSRASVQRYLYAAEDAGLLVVDRTTKARSWKHNRYHLTWLSMHQTDALSVPQTDALTPPLLRKAEAPSVEETTPTAAPPYVRNSLDGSDWRPNLWPRKCASCHSVVKRLQGRVGPDPAGDWIVLHTECRPPWMAGARGDGSLRTVGEIFGHQQRVRLPT